MFLTAYVLQLLLEMAPSVYERETGAADMSIYVNLVPMLFPLPRELKTLVGSGHVAPTFWLLANHTNVEDVLKIHSCSYLA